MPREAVIVDPPAGRGAPHHAPVPPTRGSVVALLVANAVPLLGALAWGWDAWRIVVVYWLENVILGVLNVGRILLARPDGEGSGAAHHASKAFLVPFFLVHYGLFTTVHGVFVYALLGDGPSFLAGPGGPFGALPAMVSQALEGTGAWAGAALAGSHTLSFVQNYVRGGEWRHTTASKALFAPYGRVVVLHLAILFGALGATALGNALPVLLLLIAGKTALDLAIHLRLHRRLAGS